MSTAIIGVHSSGEAEIRSKYPSIAATGLGRIFGTLFDCIPAKIWGVKLSYLVFVLPLAPVGTLLYFYLKLFGERYVLTNRSVQRWAPFGTTQYQSVALTDITEIEHTQQPGQEFYHASDLVLTGKKGEVLMRINGIQNADVFREIILKAREAQTATADALATISARG